MGERIKFKRPKKWQPKLRLFPDWRRREPSPDPFHAPEGPIAWKPEALVAYRRAYSTVRQWPGNRNYFEPICRGLDAALIAQGLPPCPVWTGVETGALARAERAFFADGGPLTLYERHVADAALAAGLNAAIAALGRRVTPFISRAELRTRQRARRIEEVKEETANWHKWRAVRETLARSRAAGIVMGGSGGGSGASPDQQPGL